MKRTVLVSLLALALAAGTAQAQMGSGMMGGSTQEEYSGEAEQEYPAEMGPGMMSPGRGMGYGRGYGMGPGMMHGYGMGHGRGYGMGPGMMGGCCYGMGAASGIEDPEKQRKFLDDTVELRKKIHDKMFQYHEASRNPKSTVGSLNDMEKEIYDLQKKLEEKAQEYQE